MIEQLQVYYFSGTGNARNVCYWLANEFEKSNKKVKIVDISKLDERKVYKPEKSSLIGFVGPTHGFNFPPILFHFILRFPKGKGNKVIIINTRAGLKMGKYFVPGLSGLAQYFSALILMLKGYKVVGMRSVDLPSNWISLHPGVKQKVADSMYGRCEAKVRNFAKIVANNGKSYRALLDLLQDLLISPVSIGYYLFGRFIFAKSFIASRSCTKCGACVQHCPVKAIKWVDKRPFWKYTCESCMHCMNICPERAIETAHGFIFLLIFLVNGILLYHFYSFIDLKNYLSQYFSELGAKGVQALLSTIVFFVFLLLFYRLLHLLLRFKFIERIVVYTSLTKYKFWRRYKIRKVQ